MPSHDRRLRGGQPCRQQQLAVGVSQVRILDNVGKPLPMDPLERPRAKDLPDPWGEPPGPAVQQTHSGIRIPDPWHSDFVRTGPTRAGFVYVVQDTDSKLYKIGRTQNMDRRMQELGVGRTATLIASNYVSDAVETERQAHIRYKSYRLPQTEYFRLPHPPSI